MYALTWCHLSHGTPLSLIRYLFSTWFHTIPLFLLSVWCHLRQTSNSIDHNWHPAPGPPHHHATLPSFNLDPKTGLSTDPESWLDSQRSLEASLPSALATICWTLTSPREEGFSLPKPALRESLDWLPTAACVWISLWHHKTMSIGGNLTLLKKQTKEPVNDPKEMDIYKLPGT